MLSMVHMPTGLPVTLANLSWWDEGVSLGWRYPLAGWAWLLIVLGAAALAGWSYSRLMGSRQVRVLLALLRTAVLLAAAVLLAGPTLVKTDERVEQDTLLVLVDRSASMQLSDAVDSATGEALSRDTQLRQAIAAQQAVFGDADGLAQQRQINWLGFGGQVQPIGSAAQAAQWPTADKQTTHLRTAIEQALQTASGRPISGIVLFTDGRSPQTTGSELVRRLQQQAVSVFPVPLGAQQLPLDLMLSQVDAPAQAFTNDLVPVSVTVNQLGGMGPVDLSRVRLKLLDEADGKLLDERTLEGQALDQPVRLSARSDRVGSARWRVEVVLDPGPGGAQRELVTRNNSSVIAINLIDRPLNVLYIEGYPRWEYRYLKNMLVRETSIASSMYLLSSDRGFAQEGDVPITRLPETAQEISHYDVVILGDVPADTLTPEQMTLLRDHVAGNGAGLMWIGGSRSTPRVYEGSVLADLLPMQQPGGVQRLDVVGVKVAPTPLAKLLSVLELRSPGGQQTDDGTWPTELAPLRWVQEVGRLKPAADVLGQMVLPSREADALGRGDEKPLVVRMRYGAGQSLYVATDDTWRWRMGRGEVYFEQFWIQLVRMLGRQRVQQTGDRAQLTVSNRRISVGETVVVQLTIEDPALLSRQLPRVAVSVLDDAGLRVDQLELMPVEDAQSSVAQADARKRYQALWRAGQSGALTLRVVEPALDALNIAQDIEVISPDDELRQPRPDHQRLIALAQQTGGQVVALDELSRLIELVPNRDRRTPNDIRQPMWHSYWALLVVLILLTGEWVVRKMVRLV